MFETKKWLQEDASSFNVNNLQNTAAAAPINKFLFNWLTSLLDLQSVVSIVALNSSDRKHFQLLLFCLSSASNLTSHPDIPSPPLIHIHTQPERTLGTQMNSAFSILGCSNLKLIFQTFNRFYCHTSRHRRVLRASWLADSAPAVSLKWTQKS